MLLVPDTKKKILAYLEVCEYEKVKGTMIAGNG